MTEILGQADFYWVPLVLIDNVNQHNFILQIFNFLSFYGLFLLIFLLDNEDLLLVLHLDILCLHNGHIVQAGGTPVQLGEDKPVKFVEKSDLGQGGTRHL